MLDEDGFSDEVRFVSPYCTLNSASKSLPSQLLIGVTNDCPVWGSIKHFASQ